MTETAPERIWATGNGETGSWNASPATFRGPIETQFVRADLLDDAVKALELVAAQINPGDDSPGDTFVDLTEKQTEQIFAALARAKEQA